VSQITLISAGVEDAYAVAQFCQPIYEAVYPNSKYAMLPEHFSKEVFTSLDTIQYFEKTLAMTDNQRAYLAMSDDQIVGTISIEQLNSHYEINAFYVALTHQRQGIGKRLMTVVLTFATNPKPVRFEVAETNTAAIEVYLHWGFKHAAHLGVTLRHWPEWPEGLHNGYIFLEALPGDINV
jgi:GNAT superfamily N-acetyltransferase